MHPKEKISDKKERRRPTGVKEIKSQAATNTRNSGLLSLADALHDKNKIKKSELRLRCIMTLPDGPVKTAMLI